MRVVGSLIFTGTGIAIYANRAPFERLWRYVNTRWGLDSTIGWYLTWMVLVTAGVGGLAMALMGR